MNISQRLKEVLSAIQLPLPRGEGFSCDFSIKCSRQLYLVITQIIKNMNKIDAENFEYLFKLVQNIERTTENLKQYSKLLTRLYPNVTVPKLCLGYSKDNLENLSDIRAFFHAYYDKLDDVYVEQPNEFSRYH